MASQVLILLYQFFDCASATTMLFIRTMIGVFQCLDKLNYDFSPKDCESKL